MDIIKELSEYMKNRIRLNIYVMSVLEVDTEKRERSFSQQKWMKIVPKFNKTRVLTLNSTQIHQKNTEIFIPATL